MSPGLGIAMSKKDLGEAILKMNVIHQYCSENKESRAIKCLSQWTAGETHSHLLPLCCLVWSTAFHEQRGTKFSTKDKSDV